MGILRQLRFRGACINAVRDKPSEHMQDEEEEKHIKGEDKMYFEVRWYKVSDRRITAIFKSEVGR